MNPKLIERRDAAKAAMLAILNRYTADESLSTSDQHEFDRLSGERRALAEQLDRVEADDAAIARAETVIGPFGRRSAADSDLEATFRAAIRTNSLAPIDVEIPRSEMRSGFQPGLEKRAIGTTTGGGLLPVSFWAQLQTHLVENSAILSAGATVIQSTSGEPLKIPKTTALSTAVIVAEGTTIPASDPTLATVTLGAYKYGFLVQATQEMVEDEKFDLTGYLAREAGQALSNAFGAHAITGTGTGQPRGILTDASAGITGPVGTATSLGAQGTVGQGGDLLLDLMGSLLEPYSRSASAAWLMNRLTLTAIRKLRDTTGRYVFDPAIIPGSGASGSIFGRPVYVDPTMPNMAANAKSILFGDIGRYFVRQVNGLRFERSLDFAFDKDLISFRCLARLDGALTDTTGAVKYFTHSAT